MSGRKRSGDERKRAYGQLRSMFVDQDGRCCYCDGKTWMRGEGKERAMIRLGIPVGFSGSGKMLDAASATREHLKRVVDGGREAGNLKMACQYCNTHRGGSEPDIHRVDMQVLVAAGLHPVHRLPGITLDDAASHMKRARKALKKLRAGQQIT